MKKFFLVILAISQLIFAESKLTIKNINILNNKEIPVEVIESNMSLKVGQDYTAEKMVNDYISLKKLNYIKEIKIYPDIQADGINLVVTVTEKENSKQLLKDKGVIPLSEMEKIDKSLTIKDISISGLNYLTQDKIKELVPLTVGGYFSKTKALEGKNNLLNSGYFYSVEPAATKYEDGVYLVYNVVENMYINGIEFKGNTLFTNEQIKEKMKSKEKNIFNYNELREDKNIIDKLYKDGGYGLGQVYDVQIDPQTQNIIFYISEGVVKDIVFRKVNKRDNDERRSEEKSDLKTEDFVLQREIVLEKGKPLETAKFEKTARNLFRLGIFKNVTQEFESVPDDPNSKIVVFLLDEQKTAAYQGTVSYGASSGLAGSLSVSDTNFKGNGQSLSLTGTVGESSTKSLSLSFSDPWIKGTDKISLSTSIYDTTYEDDDSTDAYYVEKFGFKLTTGKALTDKIRLRIGPKFEHITEMDEDENPTDKYNTLSLLPAIVYDTRNNIYTATSGEYASLEVELGKILDRNNYYTTELELRKYHKGFFEKNTFAYRTVFGVGSDELKDSQKFRVGGGSTLRGYDSGEYKGNYEFYANLENRTRLNDNFEVVGFMDFGRAWDKTSTTTSTNNLEIGSDIKTTYGIGLRIQTPIGPLRFDYGWPLGDSENTEGQFYFNIGQLF
ncbi:MAG: BamA/TamA family outer membrane protein [Fusobacteriaceae bacterium]|nr:BamA/TamA family outer membrane protein [Fusobacteriaceae bacterium]